MSSTAGTNKAASMLSATTADSRQIFAAAAWARKFCDYANSRVGRRGGCERRQLFHWLFHWLLICLIGCELLIGHASILSWYLRLCFSASDDRLVSPQRSERRHSDRAALFRGPPLVG